MKQKLSKMLAEGNIPNAKSAEAMAWVYLLDVKAKTP